MEHLNPETLIKNAAFTQVVAVSGPHKVVHVGGQNAVDATTRGIVGRGDLRAQTEQVFRNLRAALSAAGASLEQVVKWNVYVVHGQDLRPALEVSRNEWGAKAEPPAITMLMVAGLSNPEFLIEIDALAVVPLPAG
jgi:enamine deaminase RidA (YjgF/YER057c/UK114 family)